MKSSGTNMMACATTPRRRARAYWAPRDAHRGSRIMARDPAYDHETAQDQQPARPEHRGRHLRSDAGLEEHDLERGERGDRTEQMVVGANDELRPSLDGARCAGEVLRAVENRSGLTHAGGRCPPPEGVTSKSPASHRREHRFEGRLKKRDEYDRFPTTEKWPPPAR